MTMIFHSAIVVRQLQRLERQVADAPGHHETLRAALTRGDRHDVRRVADLAERHVRAMAITAGHLKARVVPVDGLGDALESLSELALRATRQVVITELHTLLTLLEAHAERSQRPPPWGRLQGIDGLTLYVRAELDRITAPWRALRGRAYSERAAYCSELHAAHAAMRRFGTASELAQFLWDGWHRGDWLALRAVCARMSIALTVRIDVEPDHPLVVVAPLLDDPRKEQAS